MKKTIKKKDTILSVLIEIRDILKYPLLQSSTDGTISKVTGISLAAQILSKPDLNRVTITIPKGITGQMIYRDSDNKTSKGTPLLYNINWYKDEKFFTTEKTRGGTYTIDKEINHKGKTWQECKDIAEKANDQFLNFAEWLYILWKHEKDTGERLFSKWEYLWTSSRDSDGRLVNVGDFDDYGAHVDGHEPVSRRDDLGLVSSVLK